MTLELELVNEVVTRADYAADRPRRCHGCAEPTPTWPLGWLYVDEPKICWCPSCLLLFGQAAR